jgi:hypothetical protein
MTAPLGPVREEDMPWAAWTPETVATHLAGLDVTWAVAGGWAIDLFLGRVTRAHEDVEIVVPAADAESLMRHFPAPAWAWRVPFPDELRAPDAEALDQTHQTWLWQDSEHAFVLDVFRNLHDAGTWICHRDESIRAPWENVVARTSAGIPHLAPEVVLLHKAKHQRPKDLADLEAVLPHLGPDARSRLRDWLGRAHPGHPWLDRLD